MGYLDTSHIQLGDGPQVDAFSRLRISNPITLLDSSLEYGKRLDVWEEWFTGSGSAAANTTTSSVNLQTTTASGDKASRQSHRYTRYQPSKSHLIVMTAVLGAPATNLRRRLGYFDDYNGVYFEQTSSGLAVKVRTSTSGSAVDSSPVYQSSWNIDKFDGTGPSGITLNQSNGQIFFIDLQWLSLGRIRFGFVVNGQLYYCHQVLNANNIALPYMATASLPIRYELENLGTTSSSNTFMQICCAVISEGSNDSSTVQQQCAFTPLTGRTISSNNRTPLLTIEPKLTFNSVLNRGQIIPNGWNVNILPNSNNLLYSTIEIVLGWPGNPVTLTGASFSSVNSLSICNVDTSATAISGGQTIDAASIITIGNNTQSSAGTIMDNLIDVILGLNHSGTIPDSLSIVVTNSISATVVGNITFDEKL